MYADEYGYLVHSNSIFYDKVIIILIYHIM